MIQISHLSVLEFKGSDASQFLQNQLSADIAAIRPGDSGFACCCNPAGRVLALMLLHRAGDSCLVLCGDSLAATLADWLRKYVLRANVTILKRPDLAVAGLNDLSETAKVHTEFRIPGALRYATVGAGSLPDAEDAARQEWKAAELASGICWLEPASSGRFLPQMLGFESIGALSFKKGCYPGQEIIARTRYLGKLKRRPVLCRLQASPDIQAMSKVTLTADHGQASAVVADLATARDGSCRLLLVARMEDPFESGYLLWDGQEFAASFEYPS